MSTHSELTGILMDAGFVLDDNSIDDLREQIHSGAQPEHVRMIYPAAEHLSFQVEAVVLADDAQVVLHNCLKGKPMFSTDLRHHDLAEHRVYFMAIIHSLVRRTDALNNMVHTSGVSSASGHLKQVSKTLQDIASMMYDLDSFREASRAVST